MKAFVSTRTETVVNVVPPSTAKRRGSSCGSRKSDGSSNDDDENAGQRPNKKRIKKSSLSVEKKSPAAAAATFEKLDPKDPVQAKRIQQRRKAISKGKNTAGYDAYIQQVPKESRRPRSMATPATPDPTMDISQKRWNGQVRAWRKALHQYDPPDLLNNSQTSACSSRSNSSVKNDDAVVPDVTMTFEKTTTSSAPAVPATPTPGKRPYVRFCDDDDDDDESFIMDNHSPLSVKSDFSGKRSLNDLEDDNNNLFTEGVGGDDDSDDDLL